MGFHDEWVCVFIVSKLFTYSVAFSKLIWVGYLIMFVVNCFMVALSLDCRSVALNMFAIMFFCLIINFNVMFLFWSLFYSKSIIHFHQREIAIASFSCRFIWWTKFQIYLYYVCQFIDRYQRSSLAIIGSFLFYWRS